MSTTRTIGSIPARRARRLLGVAATTAVVTVLLSGCLVTRASTTSTVTAPDPSATEFGSAFAMDDHRLVVRAQVGGSPVLYVFDDTASGWQHHSTITAPAAASPWWGRSVAVDGDVVAVADAGRDLGSPTSHGAVTLHRWTGTQWAMFQTITSGMEWDTFGTGVWLSGDGLVVASPSVCDGSCSSGAWTLYHRYGGRYLEVFRTMPGIDVSVGVDAGRFAIGVPGGVNDTATEHDNTLRVIDANVTLPRFVVDEIVPYWNEAGEPTEGLFRKVDLSGDLLAYESCCTSDSRLHLRRFDGSAYQPEATFPLVEESAGIVAMDDLVLVADAEDRVFHAYAFHEGEWRGSSDLKLPPDVGFAVPSVAAGHRVAVAGDEAIHVLTVEVVSVT